MAADCCDCSLVYLKYNGGAYPPACFLNGWLRRDEKDCPLPPLGICPMRSGFIDEWLVKLFKFRMKLKESK